MNLIESKGKTARSPVQSGIVFVVLLGGAGLAAVGYRLIAYPSIGSGSAPATESMPQLVTEGQRIAALRGLIAIYVTGTTLNATAGVGFIALFGVAVMNGVVMVANLNRGRDTGVSPFESVLIGAGERLRPVLMRLRSLLWACCQQHWRPASAATYSVVSRPLAWAGSF